MPAKESKKPVIKPGAKPVEKIKEEAHKAARAATAPAPVRRYRAVLFLILLLIVTAAFAVLTFLVKTTSSFPLDLQKTLGIQSINIPAFGGLMTAVSWLGFSPQSVIITALIILLVFFGLLVLLIGVSRIYVGEHWASDVVGAYLLGTLMLVGIIQLYRWGKPLFFVQQPVAKAET